MAPQSRVTRHPQAEPELLGAPAAPLVTPGFHPLADFASFGPDEAGMLREAGIDLEVFAKAIAESVCDYLVLCLPPLGVRGASVDRDAVEEWLTRSATGPFGECFAQYLRDASHVAGGATLPGVSVPLPPQMVIGFIAWLEGEILVHLAGVSDTVTLSGVGGIWMDLLMLQLGIMLEPVLGSPSGPLDGIGHHSAELHPYARLAGFGVTEGRILGETAALVEPAAGSVLSLAHGYLLSRPESAGYFEAPERPAMARATLNGCWTRSAADALHQELPAQLVIALMGWAELRLMTALNTMAFGTASTPTFGALGDPGVLADVGKAWMKMLTLELGVVLDPYLKDSASRY